MTERRINPAGLDLLKLYEGLRLRAYRDSGGVWTIGYGHTLHVRPGQVITQAQADDLLRADLHDAEAAVTKLIDVPLNDNEFSALVSFTYNLGAGALKTSTLRRLLNADDREAAARQFYEWVKVGKRTSRGLIRRRYAEMVLFKSPTDESPDTAR